YVIPPSLAVVRPWFATIGYSREIKAKGTLKKGFLPPRWRLPMAQIIQCLGFMPWEPFSQNVRRFWEPWEPQYVTPPSLAVVRPWFATIGYSREIKAKGTLKKGFLPPRWRLPMAQIIQCLVRKIAKDKSPSHPLAPTPVVAEMHKEAQQAADGRTSLGDTSEEGAHPQPNCGMYAFIHIEHVHSAYFIFHPESASRSDALADSTAEADPRISAPNKTNPSVLVDQTKSVGDGLKTAHTDLDTFVPHPPSLKSAQIQDLMAHVYLLQSQKDMLEQQKAQAEAEFASLKARPSYLDINKLTKLLVTSLKPELSKLLASHDFASCLPTKMKELPSKITKLSEDVKGLKKHVQGMEIELPRDLNDIPTKLDTFTCTVSSLKFASIMKNASYKAKGKGVPSAGPATASPAEEEKNTNLATKDAKTTKLHNELVDLLGIDIVTQYYNKKLLYDKYFNKMLKRRKGSKIIN
nr:hypothetical protein [Tanacetum cinerariifolium]